MKKVHIASWDHETLMDMKVDDHQIEVLEGLQSAGILEFEIVKEDERIERLLKSTERTFPVYSEIELMIKKMNEAGAAREATNRDILVCVLQLLKRAGFIALMDQGYGGVTIENALKQLEGQK